jgi:multicomponent Na+:H+ antiporter subunit E
MKLTAGRVLLTAWLVVVWVALWGPVTTATVAGGLAVAGAVQMLPAGPGRRTGFTVRPVATVRFLGYFVAKLVEASVVVAVEVATPRNRISTGIVAVPLRGASDALVTLVADAVTLTPGTLTIEVGRNPPTLYVHVLHLRDVEAVRQEIRHLEVLAVRAFGSRAALAGLAADDSALISPRSRSQSSSSGRRR